MGSISGRTTYAWRQILKNLRATATHCAVCWQPLNPDLKWPHPYSTTGGHIRSWRDYPELRDDPTNAQAEHLHCNSAGGAAMTNGTYRQGTSIINPDWWRADVSLCSG